MNIPSLGIHWFRRDLRLAGNYALALQRERHQGRVLGVFAFDQTFLSRPDFSHNRFQLFLKTLKALQEELRAAGSDLLVLDQGPDQSFEALRSALHCALGDGRPQTTISWHRDYEPFARRRDDRLIELFKAWGWSVMMERDHLLVEPHEIASQTKTPFKVYTPFAKKWFEGLQTPEMQSRLTRHQAGLNYLARQAAGHEPAVVFNARWTHLLGDHMLEDHLDRFLVENNRHVTVPIPSAGARVAWHKVTEFKNLIGDYKNSRDRLDRQASSGLSVFLKNGSVTVSQLILALELNHLKFSDMDGPTTFLKELVWREFYYHILWHFPSVEQTAFVEKYREIQWQNDPEYFEAWKNGQTGYPIVDAAMRQLKTTGLMHNRARMIVASFLTKDLLIDWRWGERWFMEQLLDGDLAPNNGGWQWAASTGCDAQPYFRIFNPRLQAERFDPEGHYIRRYVTELRTVGSNEIHNPLEPTRIATGYPFPIVDHATQKEKALKLFKI